MNDASHPALTSAADTFGDTVAQGAEVADQLDTRGLRCPEPLMRLRHRMRTVERGAVLHVATTDPASVRDFEQFCRFLGHEMIQRADRGEELHFLIRKGGRA